jgi:hypothetical protein
MDKYRIIYGRNQVIATESILKKFILGVFVNKEITASLQHNQIYSMGIYFGFTYIGICWSK